MVAEIRRLGETPPSQAELDARKAAMIGEFGRSAATSLGLAAYLSSYAAYGVDPAEVDRFAGLTQAVGPSEAQAATAKVVDPTAVSVVVVGDAKTFLPALKQRFPDVQLIEAGALDLDTALPPPSGSGTPTGRR
jgi:zinc protease